MKDFYKKEHSTCAVILAAGCGTRMSSPSPKHRLIIADDSVIRHTVRAFDACTVIDDIVVVTRDEEISSISAELVDFKKICAVIPGGESRAESARLGFFAIPDRTTVVAIHDAARCLVTPEMIEAVVLAARGHGAASAGTRPHDTVKLTDGERILSTLNRDELFMAHTPQAFDRALYSGALEGAELDVTDDNSLLERIGVSPVMVDTGATNIKITTPDDLLFAEFVLSKRSKL